MKLYAVVWRDELGIEGEIFETPEEAQDWMDFVRKDLNGKPVTVEIPFKGLVI